MSDATVFPIVGVGCSAGGLEALEELLSHVSVESQAAYIVIQHLDADHKSNLAVLLQRITRMQVTEITDQIQIEPRCVYVIPPGKALLIKQNRLLLMPLTGKGRVLPIDYFFRSLAQDRGAQAIAIVLSGMGSDGVAGLRAIKKNGGLCLVQEPSTAKSNSMPSMAIEAGLADYIDAPAQLAALTMVGRSLPIDEKASAIQMEQSVKGSSNAYESLMALLHQHTGYDFRQYKSAMVLRRLERRMTLHQLSNLDDYLVYTQSAPQELDFIFGELLIGVTQFFRDPSVWDYLSTNSLPQLLAAHPTGAEFRAWVPACSSGEEAYTLAICFKEVIDKIQPRVKFSLQIYATDLDLDAITKARAGFYSRSIEKDVSDERLQRYFLRKDDGYQVKSEIREMLKFAQHNVIADPAFTKMDVVSCRNLLIYFDNKLQKKLLPLLYFSLNRNGLLLLGNSEGVGAYSNLFIEVDSRMKIYRRAVLGTNATLPKFDFEINQKAKEIVEKKSDSQSLEYLTDQLIQQNYAPAAVLVNHQGDIVYISGRVGKYLEPAAGKVDMNIYAMARPGLREVLAGMIESTLKQSTPVILHDIKISAIGQKYRISVTLQAINESGILDGKVLIVFHDLPELTQIDDYVGHNGSEKEKQLANKLSHNRTELQSMHSEMQTSLNQFKTANAALKTANDELQATNEELTISKEELQSLNEEMQVVNAELQASVDELSWTRNDMANLLNSTELATIFLDRNLKIRRFTNHATQLYKLMRRDIGRLLSDIVSELDYSLMNEDVHSVLESQMFKEIKSQSLSGRCYRIRIMPYKTTENVIDGVVITFVDISEIIKLESELLALKNGQADGS